MWRAFFLAAGGILVFTGIEALVLDHAVLASDGFVAEQVETTEKSLDEWGFEVERKVLKPATKTVKPPEWAPWSMMSSGTVILLYSLLGKRGGG